LNTVKKTSKQSKYELVDYAFWFLLILFSNPGGIFQAFGEDTSKSGSIDMRDFILALLFGCFMLISYKSKVQSKTYKKIVKHLIIFLLYYFVVYGYLIPIINDNPGYVTFSFLKKSRKTVYSILIFIMVYRFYIRSYVIFFKSLIISSIIILSLFFITFISGVEILPISTHNRGFVDVDRVFIASEGIMALLIPMGAAAIVFKSKTEWKTLTILAFFMMFMNYVLSITRRDIIGTFIFFILASILYNYFTNKPLIPIKKILSISFYIVLFGFFISLSFPKYLDAGYKGLEESISIVKEGETSSGKEDVRLGLGKEFMQNLIINNIWFGTGFDNRWRGTGDREGFEPSDYPFLSAIAMMGVFGILVFLPIYVIIFKAIVFDVKFLKKYKVDYQSFEFFFFILFILYIIYDLMQYMNWFKPVSLSRSFKWYAYLAWYIASREIFYHHYLEKSERRKINSIKTV